MEYTIQDKVVKIKKVNAIEKAENLPQLCLDIGSSTYVIATNYKKNGETGYPLYDTHKNSIKQKIESFAYVHFDQAEKGRVEYDQISFGKPKENFEHLSALFVNWKNVFFDATATIDYPLNP